MLEQQADLSQKRLVDDALVEDLRSRIRGSVLRPGDDGYDDARSVQNGLIDRRPAIIVRATGTADVIEAVNFARASELPVSAKAGGHNVAGNAIADAGVTIDLSLMRAVHVDSGTRVARVQGGATWADVDRETQVFGLATPGGLVSTTGVAGLTLHGGMGHLRRKYGLSLDNLLAVDIVTADGRLRRASESENSDLFWAVRGAGSNFGIVTSFEFRLHPVGPIVMLAATLYARDDAPDVLPKWRDFMATAPDEVSSVAVFWSVPDGFPDELVGTPVVIIAAVYAGEVEEGERILQPLRELGAPLLDLSAPEQFTSIQSAFDPFFPKGLLSYWKSTYVDELTDDLIRDLTRIAAARPSPKSALDIWHHGGAVTRVGADETAFGRRAPYMLAFEANWTDPADNEPNIIWARDAYAAMRQFSSKGIYLNFPGFGEEQESLVRAAYGDNYDRLVQLKSKYDPTNMFRFNQNIKPSTRML